MVAARLPRFGVDEDDEEETGELTSVKLASVGMVTAGLAQQIASPLSIVIANLDVTLSVLRAREDLGEMREAIEDAAVAAEQLTRLVQSLTTYVRGGRLERRRINLPEVVDAALRIAGATVRARASLVTQIDATPPVVADERLVHVVVNLLRNAAHAAPSGDAHEVRLRACTDARGRAVIEVSDSGAGLSSEELSRVFDPYVPTDSASGVGLALWICQRIVQDLGGEIVAESEQGRGSTIRVALSAAP